MRRLSIIQNPKKSLRKELWKKFIDPRDWEEASTRFPTSPWQLYLKPHGGLPSQAWRYYQSAVRWMRKKTLSGGIRPRHSKLTIKEILALNSLILKGTPTAVNQTVRERGLASVPRTYVEIRSAFPNGPCFKNPDGLTLKVEGFWPLHKKSIEFFATYYRLAHAKNDKDAALKKFRRVLYKTVDDRDDYWRVYHLIRPQDINTQLDEVLKWYGKKVDEILSHYVPEEPAYLDAVIELAVKMQRYIDITHIAKDGSARTSKLIQDYVFLQFGIEPPKPVLFHFNEKFIWTGGTYFPIAKAIEMAKLGLNPWQESSS